jgi:V/A-type H+-transporting ATPase subunit A
MKKQYLMLKLILLYYELAKKALSQKVPIRKITTLPVKEEIARAKYIPENELGKFKEIENQLKTEIDNLSSNEGEGNA